MKALLSEAALFEAIRSALASDRDGALRSPLSSQSPTCSRQEMADRHSRMAASTHTRRVERLQMRALYPRAAALQVMLLASAVNIVEE
jgi:hypothetical protein